MIQVFYQGILTKSPDRISFMGDSRINLRYLMHKCRHSYSHHNIKWNNYQFKKQITQDTKTHISKNKAKAKITYIAENNKINQDQWIFKITIKKIKFNLIKEIPFSILNQYKLWKSNNKTHMLIKQWNFWMKKGLK